VGHLRLKSYNQLVSKWRLAGTAAALVLALIPAAAQQPTLDAVLKRAAAYVAAFRQQLSGIAAEESYRQEIVNTARFVDSVRMLQTRRLKSDLLLIKPAGAERYVELRDVFEVDGAPIRDRRARLEELLNDRSATADARLGEIIRESARYNIGGITRNINTPLMALQFLDASNQQRVQFKHVDNVKSAPVFPEKPDAGLNEITVFRTTTEMWNVEYRERGRNTMIRTPSGDNLPARGRFWINPSDGSVLISELIVDGGGVRATVTVSYQSEPLMGFLVPVEMRESYLGRGERITGEASYGKFRALAK
jgi:hypothetical protein